MFSSRLPWTLPENRLSARKQSFPYLDLTESNPTRAGFQYPTAEILAAFHDPQILTYDPASTGLPAARALIAREYNLSPDRICLTTSTSEAYAWLFKLLCDPGDEVLAPQPSYPLFDFLAALESVRIVPYPLVYHGEWSIDFPALEAALGPRTRAIVIVNPNNPTGHYLKDPELAQLLDLCDRHRLAILSDEVFSDYALTPDPRRVTTLTGVTQVPVFCLNGLSKLIGMPQMKLGWIVANRHEASERLELIADTYLSVGTPVQYALPALLAARHAIQAQILARLQQNLAYLTPRIPTRKVEGGWSAILQVPRTRSEEDWALALLEESGVLVQPGYFYDFASEAFLVLSLLTPTATFAEGVERIAKSLP